MIRIKIYYIFSALVWIVIIIIACNSTTRYEVLNFFFDGVPSPEETTDTLVMRTFRVSAFRASLDYRGAFGTPQPTPLAPRIVSVHEPYAGRKCTECHDVNRGLEPIAWDAKLCDRCHKEQREREGWDHGPINLGTCVPCHQPHESQYTHLLEQPVPDLCAICHAEDLERLESYHDVPNLAFCTDCHDAHLMY